MAVDEADLLVLSDASGKIVALHTTMDEFQWPRPRTFLPTP